MKDLEQTRDRRHMLNEYYKEVEKVFQETTAISETEKDEFVAGAEQHIADLENKRYTILIAGKTFDCYITVLSLACVASVPVFFALAPFSTRPFRRKLLLAVLYFVRLVRERLLRRQS